MPAKSGRRLADFATDGSSHATAKYYSDGREKPSSKLSYDLANAKNLWESSARMAGINPVIA